MLQLPIWKDCFKFPKNCLVEFRKTGTLNKLVKQQQNHKIWVSNKYDDSNTFAGDHGICKLFQKSTFSTRELNY